MRSLTYLSHRNIPEKGRTMFPGELLREIDIGKWPNYNRDSVVVRREDRYTATGSTLPTTSVYMASTWLGSTIFPEEGKRRLPWPVQWAV